jgi:predicted nucleotidyltransferase
MAQGVFVRRPWPAFIQRRRRSLLRAADRCGARNVRLFGSVARREETSRSDVDLLVDMDRGRGMFDLMEFEERAADILKRDVEFSRFRRSVST